MTDEADEDSIAPVEEPEGPDPLSLACDLDVREYLQDALLPRLSEG